MRCLLLLQDLNFSSQLSPPTLFAPPLFISLSSLSLSSNIYPFCATCCSLHHAFTACRHQPPWSRVSYQHRGGWRWRPIQLCSLEVHPGLHLKRFLWEASLGLSRPRSLPPEFPLEPRDQRCSPQPGRRGRPGRFVSWSSCCVRTTVPEIQILCSDGRFRFCGHMEFPHDGSYCTHLTTHTLLAAPVVPRESEVIGFVCFPRERFDSKLFSLFVLD